MNFKELGILAAKKAGKIHLSYFSKEFEIKTKTSHQDKVTTADIESEKAIVSLITEHYPDHNFLGEEGKYEKTSSPYTWIIDPLDGTNNFAHNIPVFCVSIALARDNELILGIVFDPTRDELFVAEKGKGATLNGESISISSARELKEAILVTGFYYDRGKSMKETLKHIEAFMKEGIIGVRRSGSAALDLAWIACGRYDGFFEFSLNAWDFCAGKLLVEEAGGKTSNYKGEKIGFEKGSVVASNTSLHESITSLLR